MGWSVRKAVTPLVTAATFRKNISELNREWDVKMLSRSLAGSEWIVRIPLIPRILVTWHPRVASGVYLVVFVNTEGESLAR